MKPVIFSSDQEQDFETLNQAFRVVVGYEDYSSGLRAMQLYNHILELWDEPSELQLNLWKFEPLGLDKLRHAAAAEAARADMILISIRGDHRLPKEGIDWIERWMGSKRRKTSALGLIVDSEFLSHPNAELTRRYLEDITLEAGVDFITSRSWQPEAGARF